ncbi:hypothetical protein Tco_0340691 [Tanacetum coccineum]
MHQEKLKEVKARLNFEGCSRRNSKVQEVSQHSESRTPNSHRGTGREEKEEETEEYSIGWEIKERVCPHTQNVVTRVTARKERNPFPENITMKEHIHRGHKCSPRVKIAEGDTGSQNKKSIPSELPSTKEVHQGSGRNPPHQVERRVSTKDFVRRFKAESRHVRGAPECMRISRFIHGITNPELIKLLHKNIPKLVDEKMRQEPGRKQNFDRRGDFRNQQRSEQRCDKFILLTKSPREILSLDKGKFKTPPPMTTPVEKRNSNKFCEFHGEVGYNTDECMHLKRQIEELIKAGKLSHVIKELKQGKGKDQPKAAKKGETSRKDKAIAILMYSSLALVERSYSQWANITTSEDRSEENSSNSINSSQNVKIPSFRRNTYSTEQQDNPTRMHDGLRTGSITFKRHSSYGRKNQSGNSSGITRADNCNRLHPNRGRMEVTVRITQTQPRHIRVET